MKPYGWLLLDVLGLNKIGENSINFVGLQNLILGLICFLFLILGVSAVPGCTVNSGSTLFCKQKHNHSLFVELDVFDAFLSQVDKNVNKTSSPHKRGGKHSLGVKSKVPALIFQLVILSCGCKQSEHAGQPV